MVVLLGTLSVAAIIIIQVYWVFTAFDNEEKQFDRGVRIALRIVAEKLAVYNKSGVPSQNLVNRPGSNYYVVNVNSTIDAGLLDFYLRAEFAAHNISTDYEYGIYDCSTDQMMYGNYVSTGGMQQKNGADGPRALPKYNAYTYYFGVYFPHKTNYLISKLEIWILTTGILLPVLLFFGYALFVILKQKRLSEVQRDFINNMTHEFKTPISTISIGAKVLSDPAITTNPERLAKYAHIIFSESIRLNSQVEKVLQMARHDKGETKLNLEVQDLHALIAEALQNLSPGTGADDQPEISYLPCNGPARVKADAVHLNNILYNLLDNAVKYSPVPAQITLTTIIEGQKLLLRITDKGQGIAPKYQRQVFNRFFRVPTGNVHNVKGFGLGLNYVRNMVRAHKWRISLQSKPGEGSTFTITMPAA